MLVSDLRWLFFVFLFLTTASPDAVAADHPALVVGMSQPLQIVPGLPVVNSPGSRPGSAVACERVGIYGLPRIKNLQKFSHSVKVMVTPANSTLIHPNVEVCFHSNISLGIGMCPQGHWQKLSKGSWAGTISPFDHKLLDIRMAGGPHSLLVLVEEEFYTYRIMFLGIGTMLMMLAKSVSNSLVFYYSSAMAVGVILVVLMVLFQGMKLLPTGRKNSLAIFLYSSFVGVGSFLLSYLPKLLRTLLTELESVKICTTLYLATFLLICIALAGAWLGFWAIRKLILAEDGSIDSSVSKFMAWSIRIVASVMILQCSLDPLLAVGALICNILVTSTLYMATRLRLSHRFYPKLCSPSGSSQKSRSHLLSPSKAVFEEESVNGLSRTLASPSELSTSGTFYSTFHNVKERRELSKEEWKKFTRDYTKKALEDLVLSPDFNKWAAANAERITLGPSSKNPRHEISGWKRWFFPPKSS